MNLEELIALRDHEIHPERKKYFQALINQINAEKAPPAAPPVEERSPPKKKKKRFRRD
jgi:hypothetical protein